MNTFYLKINITGAEIFCINNEYVVQYNGSIVFRDRLKDVALMYALNRDKLMDSVVLQEYNNVVRMYG